MSRSSLVIGRHVLICHILIQIVLGRLLYFIIPIYWCPIIYVEHDARYTSNSKIFIEFNIL